MRIAQVAPLIEAVPPKLYGGTERVVWWLTEELVRQGQDVTLFASGDSQSSAKLVPVVPKALRLNGIRDHTASTLVMLDQVRRRAEEFDIIHFHTDTLQFPLFQDLFSKCITTLHGRMDLADFHPIYRAFPDMPLVSISAAQRRPMPPVNWASTIHHGLPPGDYRFSGDRGAYLAFLGRLSPEKRPDRAIEIAKQTGIPLKIAAKVDPFDREYFVREIEPLLNHPLIEFIGEIDDAKKIEFLGGALALMFPIDWPEPFGLVMIEAMACGTPVIAWRQGSVPEVIDHGVTGMIVSSLEEAIQAVKKIPFVNRRAVRDHFEARFTAARMAADYIQTFEAQLHGKNRASSPIVLTRPRRSNDRTMQNRTTESSEHQPQPA
jgi:glycosyltransferase involved in cell wall biosynthesis